jgi:signal transduction histidine kinase
LAGCLATTLLAAVVDGVVRWSDVASSAVFVVGSWIAGRVLATTARALVAEARAGSLEHDRQAAAVRAALDADRARVARELHDAVGHAMTAIVLQASAAVRVWHTDAALAAEHVAALRRTVAEALDGLRPLVAEVAIDGGQAPGMAAVPGLIDRARACGLRVEADLADHLTGSAWVDPTRDAVAYRIVQEALTNAARYAPGSRVALRLSTGTAEMVVTVDNDRPPYGPVESGGSGQGLRGMAERVGDCGGTLEAGPTPAGGFHVHAVLPAPRGSTESSSEPARFRPARRRPVARARRPAHHPGCRAGHHGRRTGPGRPRGDPAGRPTAPRRGPHGHPDARRGRGRGHPAHPSPPETHRRRWSS